MDSLTGPVISNNSGICYSLQNAAVIQEQIQLININYYITILQHSIGGHQGSRKAYQAGNHDM